MSDTDRVNAPVFPGIGEAGPLLDEIDRLTAENERARDGKREKKLTRLRHEAFGLLDTSVARPSWPLPLEDPFPGVVGLPELQAGQLDWQTVAGGVLHHGAVVVRGMFAHERIDPIIEHIDHGFEGFDAFVETKTIPETDPWFVPFRTEGDSTLGNRRGWVRAVSAIWAADLPRVLFEMMEGYRSAGLLEMIGGYFGEHPAISVNKTVVRKVTPDSFPSWHQDGAFLGDAVRAMNVWVTLTACGGDLPTPGLELVPRRFDELVQAGSDGAQMATAVGHDVVLQVSDGADYVRPYFAAGDGLIFDELFLHRTAVDEGMTDNRYALESWFFTPSHFPDDYVPLVAR